MPTKLQPLVPHNVDRKKGAMLPHSNPKQRNSQFNVEKKNTLILKNGQSVQERVHGLKQSLSQRDLKEIPVPVVEVRRAVVTKPSRADLSLDAKMAPSHSSAEQGKAMQSRNQNMVQQTADFLL